MKKYWLLTVRGSFSSAHSLRNYMGKCENMHGHNYLAEYSVQGDTLSEDTEILADFSVLKRILESKLDVLDHRFINEVPPFDRINPSAENLARYLWGELEPEIKKLGVKLVSVSVSEKDTQTATYREVDDGERHA
ncbi:MAG: 6-carboxytetrahydropterin synthase [Mailhella sp.]|nr:6-carboxytetrahydropterin synthase [Mailhella sp.]